MDKITLGHGLRSPRKRLCGNKILQEFEIMPINSDYFIQETLLPTVKHEDPELEFHLHIVPTPINDSNFFLGIKLICKEG